MAKNGKKRETSAEDYVNEVGRIPTIDGLPLIVDYSDRHPSAFVISGPVGPRRPGTNPKGRRFRTTEAALRWAAGFYPEGTRLELVRPPTPSLDPTDSFDPTDFYQHRWAILVTLR